MNYFACRAVLLAAALMQFATVPAEAQARHKLGAGDRVRLKHIGEKIEGRVVRLDRDAVILSRGRRDPMLNRMNPSSDTVVVPRADVTRLQVVTGRRRNTLTGVLIGFGAGGVVGGITGGMKEAPCTVLHCDGPATERGEAIRGFAIGAALGIVLGSVIGSMTFHDVWENTELPVSIGLHQTYGAGVIAAVRLERSSGAGVSP